MIQKGQIGLWFSTCSTIAPLCEMESHWDSYTSVCETEPSGSLWHCHMGKINTSTINRRLQSKIWNIEETLPASRFLSSFSHLGEVNWMVHSY